MLPQQTVFLWLMASIIMRLSLLNTTTVDMGYRAKYSAQLRRATRFQHRLNGQLLNRSMAELLEI
jgi:hypothetical protein